MKICNLIINILRSLYDISFTIIFPCSMIRKQKKKAKEWGKDGGQREIRKGTRIERRKNN